MRTRKGLRKRKIAHSQNSLCLNGEMAKQKPSQLAESLKRIESEQFDGNRSEMARCIGVAPSTVGRWIDDDMVPGSATLERISRALKVSINELLGDEEQPVSQRQASGSKDGISCASQAAAVDWLISQGEDPDTVASAASIISIRVEGASTRPKIWWVAQINRLIHELR